MTTTFTNFLRQQAEKHQAEADAGKATVDEWRTSLEALFGQIREWLKASDPEGFIEVKTRQEEIREPGLGLYQVPRLDLHMFGTWVGIIPQARKTVGTATPPHKSSPERTLGRVDITDEIRRFVLYRFRLDSQDLWVMEGSGLGGRDGLDPSRPFDRETFEAVLMSYLR